MTERAVVSIRPLTAEDAATFRELRLEALKESPTAFGSSYEEFLARPPQEVDERLRTESTAGDNFILCAWDEEGRPLGTVGFVRERGSKNRHKGMIWGVYVTPSGRGRGIGRRLMEEAVRVAGQQEGLRQIHLAVTTTNGPARALYRSLGFQVYGTEPRALLVDGEFHDEDLMVLLLS